MVFGTVLAGTDWGHAMRGICLIWIVCGATVVEASAIPSGGQGAQERSPSAVPPPDWSLLLAELDNRVTQKAHQAEILLQAQKFIETGERLDQQKKITDARHQFEQARQLLLSVDEAAFYEPELYAAFLGVSEKLTISAEPFNGRNPETRLSSTPGLRLPRLPLLRPQPLSVQKAAFRRLVGYESMMRRVFREEGLPEELIFAALVESGFHPEARSSKGAVGIWQFLAATGRRYGLNQIGDLDERTDPEKSTRAAARYLRDLFRMFGDWHLAFAAYNAGEYRVAKTIQKSGIRDFHQLSQRGLLPAETRGYVPAVMAAIAWGSTTKAQPVISVTHTKREGKP